MTSEDKIGLVSLQEGSGRKRRRASDGQLRSPALRRSCRVSEQRQEQEKEKGNEDDTGDTNESVLRKELEPLSKEDLIERIIRLKEVRNEFATLPDEIVVSIFKYLPQSTLAKTARVSKRWRRISYDPVFWKKVDIWSGLRRGTLNQVLARGCQRLSVSSFGKIERPIFIDKKPKKSYKLKELQLHLEMKPNELISILRRCPELVRINTKRIDLVDNVCEQIANCPNVTEVKFDEHCDKVTYKGYLSLFTGCPRLEIFRPHYLGNLRSGTFSADEVRSLIDVLPPAMKSISLFRCCLTLTDEHIEQLVTKVPNVESLHLSECRGLTAKSVDSISRLPQLRDLDIDYCYRIPHGALSGLLKSCSSLRSLSVEGVVTPEQRSILKAQFRNVNINCEMPSDDSDELDDSQDEFQDDFDDMPDDFEEDFDDLPDDDESNQSDDSFVWW